MVPDQARLRVRVMCWLVYSSIFVNIRVKDYYSMYHPVHPTSHPPSTIRKPTSLSMRSAVSNAASAPGASKRLIASIPSCRGWVRGLMDWLMGWLVYWLVGWFD